MLLAYKYYDVIGIYYSILNKLLMKINNKFYNLMSLEGRMSFGPADECLFNLSSSQSQ